MRVGASLGERHSSVRSTFHLRTRETRPEDTAGEASAALISSAGTRRASGATGLSIGVRSATSVAGLSELRFAESAPTGCVGAPQNGQSPSRGQSSDSSTDDSVVASRASSAAAMSSPIACRSAGSNSGTRSPKGAPPDVKPTAQISSPPHSTQPSSAKRCTSVRSASSPRWRRPAFRSPRRRLEPSGDPDDLRAEPFRFVTAPTLAECPDATLPLTGREPSRLRFSSGRPESRLEMPAARGLRRSRPESLRKTIGPAIAARPLVHLHASGSCVPCSEGSAASEFLALGRDLISRSQRRDRPGPTPGSSRCHA